MSAINLKKALEGIVICDFSWVGAGPITTNVLGQCGADVIKIEPPFGDPMRHFMLASDCDPSALYQHLHPGKRGGTTRGAQGERHLAHGSQSLRYR